MHADKELDARGLNCPLPILKAKKALADMHTRPDPQSDFDRLGVGARFPGRLPKQTGNLLVEQQTVGEDHITLLKRR